METQKKWYVYLLECSDSSFYCGITTDVQRRVFEHNSTSRGAKYTRSRRPVYLVGFNERENRSEALKEEIRIKKLTREEKLGVFRKKDN